MKTFTKAQKETDEPKHFHEGDQLADGKIQLVDTDGIVFKPPKAKQPPFALRSKQELMPIKGDRARIRRQELDDELMMHDVEHPPVMTISIVRDAESY